MEIIEKNSRFHVPNLNKLISKIFKLSKKLIKKKTTMEKNDVDCYEIEISQNSILKAFRFHLKRKREKPTAERAQFFIRLLIMFNRHTQPKT